MLKYSRITVWNNHFGCILREDKMKELLSNLDQIESDINLKKKAQNTRDFRQVCWSYLNYPQTILW